MKSLDSVAVFSDCRKYRYELVRKFSRLLGESDRYVNFLMCNPSTADESKNDPTVERCERRARSWGFDGLIVTNLFAIRSTDPAGVGAVEDPVGPMNNAFIVQNAMLASLVVCGWGRPQPIGKLVDNRSKEVEEMLRECGIELNALRIISSGQPGHPLYVPYSQKPTRWEPLRT